MPETLFRNSRPSLDFNAKQSIIFPLYKEIDFSFFTVAVASIVMMIEIAFAVLCAYYLFIEHQASAQIAQRCQEYRPNPV